MMEEEKVKVPKVSYQAAAGNISLHYDPQGSGMEHDPFFAEVAPGVAGSGNMKFKWAVPGNHSNGEEPRSNMKGE
jgi:hypothetical protein